MISFLRNFYFRLRYGYKIDRAENELRQWAAKLKAGGLPAFAEMMGQFRYRSDGPTEWIPDGPEIVVARGWQDDCDGAAVIAEWGFKQMGMPCDIWRLVRSGGGHRVCVTRDRLLFTSNGTIAGIPSGHPNWHGYILAWDWHHGKNYYKMERV